MANPNKAGTMVLQVNYTINEEDRTVRIDHESLIGSLGFEFSTPKLAEAQLTSLRLDKPKTPIEEIVEDSATLAKLFKEFKGNLFGKF